MTTLVFERPMRRKTQTKNVQILELPPTITSEWLYDIGACLGQRRGFGDEWTNGCEATQENLNRAAEIGLHIAWFIRRCFKDNHRLRQQLRRIQESYRKDRNAIFNSGVDREEEERLHREVEMKMRLKHAKLLGKLLNLK